MLIMLPHCLPCPTGFQSQSEQDIDQQTEGDQSGFCLKGLNGIKWSNTVSEFCQILFPIWLAVAPWQKTAQLDEASHITLHDAVCLWTWLRPKLAAEFPGHVCQRHDDLFLKGCLGSRVGWRQMQLLKNHGVFKNPVIF
jgi:hypothetical protein